MTWKGRLHRFYLVKILVMTFTFNSPFSLLFLIFLASNLVGQSTFDPYKDRLGEDRLDYDRTGLPTYTGEYQLYLEPTHPYAGKDIQVSVKTELVSFPFLPVYKFRDNSSRVAGVIGDDLFDELNGIYDINAFYNPGSNTSDWSFTNKFNGNHHLKKIWRSPAKEPSSSSATKFSAGQDTYANYHLMSNSFTKASAGGSGGAYREFLFHSVLKHTIYMHPKESNVILDSVEYIIDLTRGRMKYYPYTNDGTDPFKESGESEHDLTIFFDGDIQSSYLSSGALVTSEHTSSSHNIYNYFPTLSRNCWQDEVVSSFLPSQGNNATTNSIRIPEYSTIEIRPRGYEGIYPAGYRFDDIEDTLTYSNGSNELITFVIDRPIDLKKINSMDQVVYNPENVEIDISGDTLVFPSGYTFKTVLGNYTSKTTVENQDTNEYYKNNPLLIHVPNDSHSGGYTGKYIVKSGSTLKLEGCVTLMDVEIELESGATLMIDTNAITSVNLELDTANGTVIYTEEDDCSDCNFDPNLVEEQLDIIQGFYGTLTLSDTNLLVVGDLNISGNSTLTIDQGTKLYFAPESRIVIENGSTMDINGTSSDTIKFLPFCHKPWNGIEVHSDINNTSHTTAGKVEAEYLQIEGAKTAFKNYSSDYIEAEGGEIYIENSLVKNNRRGMDFHGHRNRVYSLSKVFHSKFTWDEEISPFLFNEAMQTSPLLHINLDNHEGLHIAGSEFSSELDVMPHMLGKGLVSFDSEYYLGSSAGYVGCDDTPYDFDLLSGCTNLIEDFNTFTNLSIGVTNKVLAHPKPKNVQFTTFDSCYVGILLFSSALDYIDKNLFNVPASDAIGYSTQGIQDQRVYDKPNGVYVYESQGFQISNNEWRAKTSSTQNDCEFCNYGIVLDGNNSGNGMIVDNTFDQTNVAIQGQNGNGSYPVNVNLNNMFAGDGTTILCNDFGNNNIRNVYFPEDLRPAPPQVIRNQGFCIGTKLEENFPVFNDYSICNSNSNLYNTTGTKSFKYYDDDNVIPSIFEYQVTLVGCEASDLDSLGLIDSICTNYFSTFSPEVSLTKKLELVASFDEQADSVWDVYSSFKELEDSLNLIWLIDNETEAEVINAFDSIIGFASDSSLYSLINTSNSISDSVRIELLVDNSALDSNVYANALNRLPAFADSLLDILADAQDTSSLRSKALEHYDFLSYQKMASLYGLYFQSDSSNLDTLQYYLNEENISEAVTFSFMHLDDLELRDSLLQLAEPFIDATIHEVEYPIIFSIHDSHSYYSELDTNLIADLNSIYESDSLRYAKFQVWSGKKAEEHFLWPLNSSSASEEFIQDPALQIDELKEVTEKGKVLIWPNPSSNQFQLRVIEDSKEIAEIVCLDIFGSLVYREMSQKTLYSTPNPGAYLIVVYFKDGTSSTAKLVISN